MYNKILFKVSPHLSINFYISNRFVIFVEMELNLWSIDVPKLEITKRYLKIPKIRIRSWKYLRHCTESGQGISQQQMCMLPHA